MTTAPTPVCTNPRCTCVACQCDDCRCGTPRLGALERRVMEVLWSHEGVALTGRAVADELPSYAYTTIATVLDRLARKGEVRRGRDGQLLTYAATGSDAAHTARALRAVLDASGDPTDALRQLGATLSDEELRSLRAPGRTP